MKKFYLLTLFLLFGLLSVFFYFFSLRQSIVTEQNNSSGYQRIISLSPSTTETLFALDLGHRVAGVTRFCNFPPAAKAKPQVGGYFDPNYEAILALKPDLVLLLPEQEQVQQFLDKLGLKHLTVNNKTITDILTTIRTIGETCAAQPQADALILDIETRVQKIQRATQNLTQPSALISIGRSLGTGALQEVYVAGQHTFFNELVVAAGGKNAYVGEKLDYPLLSAEGILQLNPDIILDLVADLPAKHLSAAEVAAEWNILGQLAAVRQHRVFVLSQDYIVIPGPRFILLLEDFAQIFHPEAITAPDKK
jgi:iron complex transport system substrate-binding protein